MLHWVKWESAQNWRLCPFANFCSYRQSQTQWSGIHCVKGGPYFTK